MRTRTRLIGLGLMAALGIAGWLVWRSYTAPAPPNVPLDGMDPELVALISTARNTVLDTPYSGEAWGNLAEILADNGYYEPAAECFARAAQFDSENPRWPFLCALNLSEAGKGGDALPYLLQANSIARTREERSTTLSSIAAVCIEEGRFTEAENYLKRLASVDPEYPRLGFLRGLLAAASGDRETARELLESLKESPFCRKRVHQMLANFASDDRDLARRYQLESEAMPRDEPWPNAFMKQRFLHKAAPLNRVHRYLLLQSQGRKQEALEFLKLQVEQSPDSEVCQILGLVHYDAREYDEAVKLFREAIRLDARVAENHQLLASTLFLQGEQAKGSERVRLFQEAIQEADAAVGLQPSLSYAHFTKGRALLALDRKADAIAAFREAVSSRPDAFEPHLALGQTLAETGEVSEGIKHLELAARLPRADQARIRAALDRWSPPKTKE